MTILRVCVAVHEQFIDQWKKKTKQGSSTITVIAALLVEKKNKFKVVVFTAGTKIKHKCSYFIEGRSVQDFTWGLCDGHAIAVCYRLASLYLIIEMYKLHDGEDSIFSISAEGYVLRSGINFHLFTSQPPCGFMTKEKHFLSWKPFIEKLHSLQCSSIILIGAYLGIQGPLSHRFTYHQLQYQNTKQSILYMIAVLKKKLNNSNTDSKIYLQKANIVLIPQ